MDDKNNAENEVEVAKDFVNFPELVQSWSRESSRRRDGSGKICSVLCRKQMHLSWILNQLLMAEPLATGLMNKTQSSLNRKIHMLQGNPAILNETGNETNDLEKEKLCKNEPCQPPESVLCERKKENWRT